MRRGRPWAGSGRCVAGRAARSGRAGGCRGVGGGQVRAGGWRGFGMVLAIRPVRQVLEQGGEIAAVADDGDAEFAPQRMAGEDAEVAADVGEDGADRAAAGLGGDLLQRGDRGGRRGRARRCSGWPG